MWVASVQTIDGHQQGSAGPIAWWAGDMQLVRKEYDEGAYDIYLFTLALRNTQTVPVTLTQLEWNVSDEDIIRPSPRSQSGSWPIAPLGERRFTWPYSIVCPMLYTCAPTQTVEPTWTFRFTGTTANGERIEVPITVTLPPQTLRTRFQAQTWPIRNPHLALAIEGRPGSPGRSERGGLGGPVEAPQRMTEGRHGSPGAARAPGGLGGPLSRPPMFNKETSDG
jgi:hypothetical protein